MFLLTSCATPATPPPAGEPGSVATSGVAEEPNQPPEETQAAPGSAPQVTTGADAITITGSGNGETAAIALDKPYYIVTTTNAAAVEDVGSVLVTVKGKELPAIMTMAAEQMAVFQPDAPSVVFTIEATGGYVLKFTNPPSTSGALAAPQTFTGAAGSTVTPVVNTKGNYVKLTLKYTGPADADASSGFPRVTALIYDAVTGDSVMNGKYVNKAKTEDSDGNTRDKAGSYFLIVIGTAADDTWEASITEE